MVAKRQNTDIPNQIKRKYPPYLWRFLRHCLKCDHWWLSDNVMEGKGEPKSCSRCHRYDWFKPRERKRRG